MGLRWAFSLSASEARSDFELLFRRALQSLPTEDVLYQNRFHFRNDGLACIAGRLMIRAAANTLLGSPWHSIDIQKEERGKPFLPENPFHFNISHQGDLVVLATSRTKRIGVDVMRIDEERDTSAAEHIRRLQKLFTNNEMVMMNAKAGERAKWTAFYRIWCLKEAVLKAIGTGLVNDLRTISFDCSSEHDHIPGCFINSTKWSSNGIPQRNWKFEESFIENSHCVAVGKIYDSEDEAANAKLKPKQFVMVSLEELLHSSTCNSATSDEEAADMYTHYVAKPWKKH